jgi:prepilin-type N-terminal cleavage/methylation domain-containing protein
MKLKGHAFTERRGDKSEGTMGGNRGSGSAGFTLLEVVVVITVMAIMIAIVAPAVTGVTSRGLTVTQAQDRFAVQRAVDTFSGLHPRGYFPIGPAGEYGGAGGALPSLADPSSYDAVLTIGLPVSGPSRPLAVRSLDWESRAEAKSFVPNMLSAEPTTPREFWSDLRAGDGLQTVVIVGALRVEIPDGGRVQKWVVGEDRSVHVLISSGEYRP